MPEAPGTQQPLRVLIVDDDPLLCAGLTSLLGAAGDITVVASVHDGSELLTAVDAHRPDVILVDVRMPRVDGITATRTLKARPAAPRLIIMTTFDQDETVQQALAAGADGFMLKADDPREIINAVRAAAAGGSPMSPASARHAVTLLGPGSASAQQADAARLVQALSPREREVAALIAQSLSNREIAERLHVSEATVKTQVAEAQRKLGVSKRTGIAVVAARAGL